MVTLGGSLRVPVLTKSIRACTIVKENKRRISSEKTIRVYESQRIAHDYSKYRPTYPQQVTDKIFTFTMQHGVDTKMALDLACGAGQSTFVLCSHYQRTVGVDISKAQLERAQEKAIVLGKRRDEIEFIHASAGQLPFPDASIDLLTCATAWHWLDPNTVFTEIDRVLKSPGALAVYGYEIPTIRHDKCNDKMLDEFCTTKCSWPVGPYGNTRNVINSRYKTLSLPFPLTKRFDMIVESEISLEMFRGFWASYDSYVAYCQEHPEDSNALDDMIHDMKRVLNNGKDDCDPQLSEVLLPITTSYYILLAVKNKG